MMVGWQALAAAGCGRGKSALEALEAVEKVRGDLVLVVGMESLTYLGKGGAQWRRDFLAGKHPVR